jgi:hypothetical protein
MNLFKVPYKCQSCKRTGYYLTGIDFDEVQLLCPCGAGSVQTQVPLAILVRDIRITKEERETHYRVRKGRAA